MTVTNIDFAAARAAAKAAAARRSMGGAILSHYLRRLGVKGADEETVTYLQWAATALAAQWKREVAAALIPLLREYLEATQRGRTAFFDPDAVERVVVAADGNY
jgi:hypothetical protein